MSINNLAQKKDKSKKILYITARPPYPPHKGDQLIAYEQIKQLKANQQLVYLFTFVENELDYQQVKENMGPYCKDITIVLLKKHQRLLNVLKTLVNLKPFQVNLFRNASAKRKLKQLFEDISPDIIHVQTIRVADYFYKHETAKCVDMIDALSLNMLRRARSERFVMKYLLYLEYILVKRYEKKLLRDYDQTMIVSELDRNYLNAPNIVVNPNGTFITKEFIKKFQCIHKEQIIVFHGNMQYFPNVQAVLYFVTNIWPTIHKEHPGFHFYIVGKDPVPKITNLHGKQNIVVTGFVDDICDYLSKAMLGVYPLQSGTGMQNKILEALACGLPVVASQLALQGISGIGDHEVVHASDQEKIIEQINLLIEHQELRDELGEQGQRFVHEKYSWNQNYERLIKAWQNAIIKWSE